MGSVALVDSLIIICSSFSFHFSRSYYYFSRFCLTCDPVHFEAAKPVWNSDFDHCTLALGGSAGCLTVFPPCSALIISQSTFGDQSGSSRRVGAKMFSL